MSLEGTHECPRKGCKRRVGNKRWSCGPDWYVLPEVIKEAVRSTAGLSLLDPARRAALEDCWAAWDALDTSGNR